MTQRPEPPASSHPPARRRWGLVRPRRGRMVAGVCAGIADRFGMSRGLVRFLFLLSILLPGPQVIFYLVAWILVPSE